MAYTELFKSKARNPYIPVCPEAKELIHMAKVFSQRGLTPSYGEGDHGNFSCRVPQGMMMTARKTHKASLVEDDLVYVVSCQTGDPIVLTYDGTQLPSTDAFLHWSLYEGRSEINAVLHGHDDALLEDAEILGLCVTRTSAKTNSLELAKEVIQLARTHDFIVLKDHGFLSLGESIALAMDQLGRIQEERNKVR